MAHAKTGNWESRRVYQCGKGFRTRYTNEVPLIVATARTNFTPPNWGLADFIRNAGCNKAFFIAPCACKIVRCYVNAVVYPASAAGTITVKFTKKGAVDLCSTISIRNGTADTAIDGTLSTVAGALDLNEGDEVYVVGAASDNAVTTMSGGLVASIEWMPTEA